MNKPVLKYKDYTATINCSPEDNVFYGELNGISDLITFEFNDISEAKKTFTEAVDDYIAICKKLGKTPQKPSKKFMEEKHE